MSPPSLRRLALLLLLFLAYAAACAPARPEPSVPPTPAPMPAHTLTPASEPAPAPAWTTMTYAQRSRFMKDVVVPRMRELFVEFDAKRFATFDCATCHGSGASDGSFRMPSADLAVLPGNAAGFQALARDQPQWMSFMARQVRPQMAALLGLPEVDMRHPTPDAFGCRNCHVLRER